MSNTYTANIALATPAFDDLAWDVPLRSNNALLDAQTAIGDLGCALTEQPSASLNVKVAAGKYRKADGTIGTYAGVSSQAMTLSTTNYLYLTDAGALTVNTTGFPASFHVRIATVVAGVSTITSITDSRVQLTSSGALGSTLYLSLSGGTMSDASGVVTIGLGSTNGTKVGATGDKMGFLGAAPVAKQANTVDLGTVLSNFGLRSSGGNFPINMGTGTLTCGAANLNGTVTIGDGNNFVFNTTTGSKLGTAATQKLALWGAAPVVQPSGASQAAIGALTTQGLTDSTGGTATTTISDVGAAFSQATLNNNFASLTAQLNNALTDLGTLKTLVNALRAALVSSGNIKGSA